DLHAGLAHPAGLLAQPSLQRALAQPVGIDVVGEGAADSGPALHSITFMQLPRMSSQSRVVGGISAGQGGGKENAMTDIKEFVDRYVNIWNEPDARRRRETIRDLWQEDARHLARSIEAFGHAGIETRVRNAYEKWVREKGNVFRLRDGVDGHHGTIKL